MFLLPVGRDAAPPQHDLSQDRRPDLIAASVVSVTLAILSTIGRIAARRRVKAPMKMDDYLIFAGTLMAIGVVASTIVMVHFGLGRHIEFVFSPSGLARSVVASQILYALSTVPIKLSILALYHRLFPAPALKWACYSIGGVVVAYSVAQAVCMGLQCIPLEHIWEPELPAECIDANLMYTIMAVINLLTDFIILGLPLPYILGLSLQKARKVQLIAVFMLGGLVCAFGIIRSVAVGTAATVDQSWNDVNGGIWSEVEICIGVVSANLPCLRPLFFWLPRAIRGSSNTNPRDAKSGPSASYGVSAKRQSGHAGAFEMARRSRIVGGGWAEMDAESDIQPFANSDSANDDANEKQSSPRQFRSQSRQTDIVKNNISRGRSPESHGKGIVVETTIETRFENSPPRPNEN